MSVSKDTVVAILHGIGEFAADPGNAAAVEAFKQQVAADNSDRKLDSKKVILQKVIEARVAEKPDSSLGAFKDNVLDLMTAIEQQREDVEVDKAYEKVKDLLG
mmetsp:Transcript_50041/g.131914  ORF Transcript_50041/g.131914 Transcript_50041/m.131914 type:complete len:103 (+) Transcript_50041:73-381(+)